MTDKTALLLVDVQEDFLARPGLSPDRATLVATLAALLEHARKSGWQIIHVHTRVDPSLSDAMPHRNRAGDAEVIAGTWGSSAPAEVAPLDKEGWLFKRFFSAFNSPELEPLLRSHGIGQLVIGGVHSHACIRDTVSDAYARGFEVVIPDGAIGSYDPAHASKALGWMEGRSMRTVPLSDFIGERDVVSHWVHRDPCDQSCELRRVTLTPANVVDRAVSALVSRQAGLEARGLDERGEKLVQWRDALRRSESDLRDALVRDIAKPLRDAEGELGYGLALLDAVIASLGDREENGARVVRYCPRGVVGLITPWNNPFAIPIGKIAPALGFGNVVAWKPALAATGISNLIESTLIEAGLGESLALLPGDSATGEAIVRHEAISAISFTGSVPVGNQLIARAGVRERPAAVQAELGGSNCAIIDSSSDLDEAAADLAPAMFSFSGQRCTAIRRVVMIDDIAAPFRERLLAAVRTLDVGLPHDPSTQIGPLIDRNSQSRLLGAAQQALRDGGRILCGGKMPRSVSEQGCWMEPTLVEGLGADHPLNQEEWFGPIATLTAVPSFDHAVTIHNQSSFGLLGALYATDEQRIAQFIESARAGILSIGKARPSFSAEGPFNGWKSSGFGVPEHGRWNRDFYCQPQVVYL